MLSAGESMLPRLLIVTAPRGTAPSNPKGHSKQHDKGRIGLTISLFLSFKERLMLFNKSNQARNTFFFLRTQVEKQSENFFQRRDWHRGENKD